MDIDIENIKAQIALCVTKKRADFVRILDQCDIKGTQPGESCTLQVIDYSTGEWAGCDSIYSLSGWYVFIRKELGYDGSIRLAVAA